MVKGIDDACNAGAGVSDAWGEGAFERIREALGASESGSGAHAIPTANEIANSFLQDFRFIDGEEVRLRFWRGGFYIYRTGGFEEYSESALEALLVRWLNLRGHTKQSTSAGVNNILMHVRSIVHLGDSVEASSWVEEGKIFPAKHLISFENGILNTEIFLRGGTENVFLQPTSKFFTIAYRPYKYDPEAACPHFSKVIAEILPDPSDLGLLQQWAGYVQTPDTSQNKFMLFLGEGANGKSVVCAVLQELVGDKSCSSVPLESFRADRTFPLGATVGRLLNLVEEANEFVKPSEAEFKKFVSGAEMTIERKYGQPFKNRPYARMTIASNNLPHFADRSGGTWRRLLIIRFDQTFDETKQDKRLTNPQYWRESGELSGIFNWALQGLLWLRRDGRFQIPESMKSAVAEYRTEVNPARSFLQDHVVGFAQGRISTTELYRSYKQHCLDHGYLHPLSEGQFAKEVYRFFPSAERTKNVVTQVGGGRAREWRGIKLLD